MSSKENRAYYLSRGLCPRCGGKSRVVEGRVLCWECQQKKDTGQIQMRNAWREAGRCTRCGRERDSDRVLCASCRAYMSDIRRGGAKAAKDRRDRLREAGMCTRCGKTWAEPGRNWCKKCQQAHKADTKGEEYRAKVNARRRERIEAGLCVDCGKPTKDGGKLCERCRESRRDSVRKYQILQRIKKEADEARRRV